MSNRKDALIKIFLIPPHEFAPLWEETAKEICVKVMGSSSRHLQGYIRFDKKSGTIELANFDSPFELKHLSMGGGSKKKNSDKYAGMFGEGLKLAALVMKRERYRVKISASNCYWNFQLAEGDSNNLQVEDDDEYMNLSCNIRRAKETEIRKARAHFDYEMSKGGRQDIRAYIFQDVKVTLLTSKQKEKDKDKDNAEQDTTHGPQITAEIFRNEWARMAIELDPSKPVPGDIIHTQSGDIILDKRFAGRLYLKGLLVDEHAEYAVGYNFASGSIGRDRQRMPRNIEHPIVGAIWEQAILDQRERAVQKYVALFLSEEECPDLRATNYKVHPEVAKCMGIEMKTQFPMEFFYCTAKGYNTNLLQSDLVRKAVTRFLLTK